MDQQHEPMSEPGLTTLEVRDLLARHGLPSGEDPLSRCVNALFDRRELRAVGTRRHRLYSEDQVDLIVAAFRLMDMRAVALKNLRGLRRFALSQSPDTVQATFFNALAEALGADDLPVDTTSSEGRSAA